MSLHILTGFQIKIACMTPDFSSSIRIQIAGLNADGIIQNLQTLETPTHQLSIGNLMFQALKFATQVKQ